MPEHFSISHDDQKTVFKFSGSFIMGILPRERCIKQPLHCEVSCVPHTPGEHIADRDIEDCAAKLRAMLSCGHYRLLEHFVGHGLIVIGHEWHDKLTRFAFTLKVAKPAALSNLATPVVSSTLSCTAEDLPPERDSIELPVAGSGRFVWFKGAADALIPPPDFNIVQIFLPTGPHGAKLLWEPSAWEGP